MGEYDNDLDIFKSLGEENIDNGNEQSTGNTLEENSDQNTPSTGKEGSEDTEPSFGTGEFSLIKEVLKSKGIDPEAIRVSDEESDVVQTVTFEDLSDEEKLELLNLASNDIQLDNDEVEIINFMRQNELDLDTLINYYKQEGIKEYLANEGAVFKSDDLSDDEIYAVSLKNLYGELTEEEIADEVMRAKENEDLFQKKVSKLREQFKEQEKLEQEKQNSQGEEDPKAIEEFISVVKNSASEIKTIGGFDLENEDIETSIDYLTKPTLTGKTKLINDLNDPSKVFKLAFYMTHGDNLIDAIHEQYSKVLNDEKYLKDRLDKLSNKKTKSNNKSSLTTGTNNNKDTNQSSDVKILLGLK